MLISDSRQFIFVHIRKAAGTSMVNALIPYTLAKPEGLGARLKSRARLEWDYQKYRFRKHEDILAAKKRMPAAVFSNYFKFAFVRNPWDRLVSEYEFIRKQTDHGRHSRVMKLSSFADFIQMQSQRRDAYQLQMLSDKDGELLVDFVGRFENLDEDWQKVCKSANIPHQPLAHINKTKHRDFREYYDHSSIDIVATYWADEIKLFKYKFEQN